MRSLPRFTKFLPLLLAVSVAIAAAGMTRAPLARYTAFAIDLNRPGGATTANVEIQVTRWSTDAERDRLLTTLLDRGSEQLLDVLKDAPRTGTIKTPDSLAYDLRYARRSPLDDGGERVVLATDRPIGFWEAARQSRTLDYPFLVIELQLDSRGEGEGKLSIATKITGNKETGTIVLENWGIQPVMLSKVKREQ